MIQEVQTMNDKHKMQVSEEKEKERRVSLNQDSVAEAWFLAKSESMKRKASVLLFLHLPNLYQIFDS